MQIDINSHRFPLTDALRNHVRRRLHYALSSIDESVQRVVVEDTQADLYVAIDRASDRAGRTLARRLERRKAGLNRARRRLLMDSPEPAYL